MHSGDIRPALGRKEGRGHAACRSLVNRAACQLTDHPLSACANQHRTAKFRESMQITKNVQIVGKRLAEADTRVNRDARPVNTCLLCSGNSPFKEREQLSDHIVVSLIEKAGGIKIN